MNIILKYVAYYRVSTKRQGESGLGLEAQQKAVHALAEKYGATIIAEYIEVETGKSVKRPKLLEAIQHAGLTNATLVVAKLDLETHGSPGRSRNRSRSSSVATIPMPAN